MKLKDLDPQKFEVPCGWYHNFDFHTFIYQYDKTEEQVKTLE